MTYEQTPSLKTFSFGESLVFVSANEVKISGSVCMRKQPLQMCIVKFHTFLDKRKTLQVNGVK